MIDKFHVNKLNSCKKKSEEGRTANNIVSIALATYNGADFIKEQLASYVKQKRRPDELIISDDCSTDGTLDIALDFAEDAPFKVKVFSNNKNYGYPQNFSRALEQCSGDYVFLSDQDDVWHPEKIERMLERFTAEPDIQLLIHDLEYCREDLSSIGQTKIERMGGVFDLQRDYVVGMATAVRAHFLRLCLPIPDMPGIDHDTWLHQCARTIHKKKIIPDVLANYRRHGSNATAKGDLNVDYIPGPDHFKNQRPIVRDLISKKTILSETTDPPIIKWLQTNGAKLVSGGYVSELDLAEITHQEISKIERIKRRIEILSFNRIKRVCPVVRFYLDGGYHHFSGWKSAFKDLIIN